MEGVGTCKFCSFEYEESYSRDDWDIFELDWERECHNDILYRLWAKKIECLFADIWWNNDVAYLLGCFASTSSIARALNIHEESVYGNLDNGLVILNLYQERHLRMIDESCCEDCRYFNDNICQLKEKKVDAFDDACGDYYEEIR